MNAKEWIDHLKLQPHPEGGYFKEVFRSGKKSTDGKETITSIYYLLENSDFSGFHRLSSPEIWYFHQGNPLVIHTINKQGRVESQILSNTPEGNFQIAIEPDIWFAAELLDKCGFSLVSCAVAPAFCFEEFEMASLVSMLKIYPQEEELLQKLCRK